MQIKHTERSIILMKVMLSSLYPFFENVIFGHQFVYKFFLRVLIHVQFVPEFVNIFLTNFVHEFMYEI